MPTPIGFFSTDRWFGSSDAGFYSDSDADPIGGFGGFIAPQMLLLTGIVPAFVACNAAGNLTWNNGHVTLHFRNSSGSARTVEIDDQRSTLEGATAFDPDVTIVVPAGGERVCGPYNPDRFGEVLVFTYSAVGGLTVAAFATG